MTKFVAPEYHTTLTGAEATFDVCPYSRDGDSPHTFITLAYAPGSVLQMVCQHCCLLTSFFINIEADDEPLVGMN